MSGLRKNSLGTVVAAFQGIGGSAPAGAAVATFTGAAFFARGALPLAALLAFMIVLLNALIIRKISSRVAGSGGYFAYVREGLGIATASFSGFYYIFYQVFALALMGLSLAVFVPAILGEIFGIDVSMAVRISVIPLSMAFGYAVSIGGVRQSTRYTAVMATAEIIVIGVSSIAILAMHPALNTGSVFYPLIAGLILLALRSGFCSCIPLSRGLEPQPHLAMRPNPKIQQ